MMNVDALQLLDSALPARVMMLAAGAVVLTVLSRREVGGVSSRLLGLTVMLAVRDVFIHFADLPGLYLLSDIIYVSIIPVVLSVRGGKWLRLVFPVLIAGASGVALEAWRLLSGDTLPVPVWVASVVPVLMALVSGMAALANGRISGSTEQSLRATRCIGATGVLVFAIPAALLGYDSVLVAGLAVPLSYGWFLVAGLRGLSDDNRQSLEAVSYYESAIDALYHLSFRVGTVLKGDFSAESIMASFNEVMMAETGADAGIVYLVDEFDDVIEARAMSGVFPPPFPLPESLPKTADRVGAYLRQSRFRLGDTLFGEVAATGKNVFIPDGNAGLPRRGKDVSGDVPASDVRDAGQAVAGAAGLPGAADTDLPPLSSFMAVPLMIEDRIIGVAALARTGLTGRFSEEDFDRFRLLANFGTLVVSNFFSFMEYQEKMGVERAAGIASGIQRAVVPSAMPSFPGLQTAVCVLSAHGVSADYYDVMRTPGNRVVGVVGDVAGKGVWAALVMAMIRSILHLVTNTDRDASTMLNWVNRGITGTMDIDHYATLGLVRVDLSSGEVEYVSAAHQPLLVYRSAAGTSEVIETRSVPIGVERKTGYESVSLRLEPGDFLILYTDGAVESLNDRGRPFGRKGLAQFVESHHHLDASGLAAALRTALESYRGMTRQYDDQTVLILKRTTP